MSLFDRVRRWFGGAPPPTQPQSEAQSPDLAHDVAPDVLVRIAENVRLAGQQVAELTGGDAAPGRAGVEYFNGFLDRQWATPDSEIDAAGRERLANVVGCYVGAALIAEFGGRWIDDGEGIGIEIRPRFIVYPLNKALKHLTKGPEDSILSMFDMVPHLLRDAGG